MRVYLSCFDALGRPLCGSDFGAVLPRHLKTDRGRIQWARRRLQEGNGWRLARVARAELECMPEGRPYGAPARILPVPLPLPQAHPESCR